MSPLNALNAFVINWNYPLGLMDATQTAGYTIKAFLNKSISSSYTAHLVVVIEGDNFPGTTVTCDCADQTWPRVLLSPLAGQL